MKDGIPFPDWFRLTLVLESSILRRLTAMSCRALVITSSFSSSMVTGACTTAPKAKALAAAMDERGATEGFTRLDRNPWLLGEWRPLPLRESWLGRETTPSVLTDLEDHVVGANDVE
jgi:hypothetical protein